MAASLHEHYLLILLLLLLLLRIACYVRGRVQGEAPEDNLRQEAAFDPPRGGEEVQGK